MNEKHGFSSFFLNFSPAPYCIGVLAIGLLAVMPGCAAQKDFEQSRQANSVEAYEAFLRQHPRGKYADLSRQQIEQLRWEQALAADSIEQYEVFLKLHPDSEYARQARSRMESLRYEQAQESNTMTAYASFLQKYPSSAYSLEALNRLETLRFEQAKAKNDIASYEEFLKDFATGPYSDQAKARLQQLRHSQATASQTEEPVREYLKDYPKGPGREAVVDKLAAIRFEQAKQEDTDEAYLGFLVEFADSPLADHAAVHLREHTFTRVRDSLLLPWADLRGIRSALRMVGNQFPYGLDMSTFSSPPVVEAGKTYLMMDKNYFFNEGTVLQFKQLSRFGAYQCVGNAMITKDGLLFQGGALVIQGKNTSGGP